MADDLKQTIRIKRQPQVTTDERGRRVWSDTVETVELELVSTQQLQTLLKTDGQAKSKIEDAVQQQASDTAVLAHDAAKDTYEFVDAEGSEDFSLVSTQMLFKILEKDNPTRQPGKQAEEAEKLAVDTGGFDPYNSG